MNGTRGAFAYEVPPLAGCVIPNYAIRIFTGFAERERTSRKSEPGCSRSLDGSEQ